MLDSGVTPKARLVEQELAIRGSCLADALGGGGITNLEVSRMIQKLRDDKECMVCNTIVRHAHVAGDASIAMLLLVL